MKHRTRERASGVSKTFSFSRFFRPGDVWRAGLLSSLRLHIHARHCSGPCWSWFSSSLFFVSSLLETKVGSHTALVLDAAWLFKLYAGAGEDSLQDLVMTPARKRTEEDRNSANGVSVHRRCILCWARGRKTWRDGITFGDLPIFQEIRLMRLHGEPASAGSVGQLWPCRFPFMHRRRDSNWLPPRNLPPRFGFMW